MIPVRIGFKVLRSTAVCSATVPHAISMVKLQLNSFRGSNTGNEQIYALDEVPQ